MKSLKMTIGLMAVALCATVSSASAQVTVSGGADIVSSYVWRGGLCAGASIQPGAELEVAGVTLGAWGSTDFNASAKEVDFYLGYSIGGFSAAITNYWWEGEGFNYFGTDHFYELSLAYDFGEKFPLSIGVNTMVLGAETDYSTYISLGYPVAVGDVAIDFEVGMTPMASNTYGTDGFAVCNLSACVSKSVKITDSFELPLFVSAILNPASEQSFLVFGTSLSF